MTGHGRHSRSRHRWLPAIVLAVVIAAMSAGAGAIGWKIADNRASEAGSDDQPTATGTHSGATHDPTADVSPDASATTAPATAEIEECRAWWARQVQVELAGDAALDQWRLHIDAMNQLVAGEITLEQATAYWNDTRVGAHRLADAFRRLDSQLADAAVRCGTDEDAGETLDACQAAIDAFDESIAAARVAMTTWEHHITDMDLFRAGKLSAEKATEMWLDSWKVGARELSGYDRRASQARQHDCA